MNEEIIKKFDECKNPVGLTLMIYSLNGEPDPKKHCGKSGTITHVDDYGQLHGTWNGLAVIPELDKFVVIDTNTGITYESKHFND